MSKGNQEQHKKASKAGINLLLIGLVILLTFIPLFINKNAEFAGADAEAETAISEINPEYKPWFSSIWTPPSSEVESLLFALQAAIGAGVIGYGLGYMHGKSRKEKNHKTC